MGDNTENFIISREIDMELCVYESEHECTRYCADFRIFSIFHEKYQQIFENSQLDYLRTDSSLKYSNQNRKLQFLITWEMMGNVIKNRL